MAIEHADFEGVERLALVLGSMVAVLFLLRDMISNSFTNLSCLRQSILSKHAVII